LLCYAIDKKTVVVCFGGIAVLVRVADFHVDG